mmetsp:Transcript_25248/g.25477  ORF Transcript_25248/g.25477 Transcript_25248/m.25477 type:complete len:229 (+) Transcript_25248:102-788(+)
MMKGTTNSKPFRNRGRNIMSRTNANTIQIISTLKPGMHSPSCFVCCHAPSCCALCSIFPCCNDPEYIILSRESSKYIYIRENSIEWNDPEISLSNGPCFGVDPCMYEIRDRISVLYYDDPIFDRISDKTRCCNTLLTCLCGGKGERIQIDSPCCFNLCQRASCPCPCLPICLPNCMFSCFLRHDIFVSDAQQGMFQIEMARKAALSDALYVPDDDAAVRSALLPGEPA